jgi:sugar transferase (PEP-CTERM system associated)
VISLVLMARVVLDRAWRVAAPRQNVLILGTEGLAVTATRELTRRGDLNLAIVGFLEAADEVRTMPVADLLGYPILGCAKDLSAVVEKYQISRIVVAMENRRGVLPMWELVKLRVQGVNVEDGHSAVAALSGRIWLDMVHPSWFVFTEGFHRSRLTLVLKRTMDVLICLLGLLLSAPLMSLVAIAVWLESGRPVLYHQTRVGLKGKPFEVLKFRSMKPDAEAQTGAQWAQREDPRITRIGAYLRKYRLDELPQLVNVVRGDMSFVGPRPERPVFVDRLRTMISYYDERHSVRPGLTGWAQVQYSYGASIEDASRKLEYDLFYLKNMSVFFDIIIVIKTLRIILTGAGAQ